MREVIYAGGSFITSDEVADALIEYAAALANAERAATIHVPAAVRPGQPDDVTILVGPSSQLMAQAVESHGEADPDAAEFLSSVAARMRQLEPPSIVLGASDNYPLDWDI